MTELNLRYLRSAGKNGCLSLLFHASSVVVCSTDIVVKQTGREGCWHTVDIQTSFHSFLLLLVHLKLESKWTQGREVAQIQSTNCADWHSKRLRACISGCPPPGSNGFGTRLGCIKSRTVTETGTYKSAYKHFEQTFYSR